MVVITFVLLLHVGQRKHLSKTMLTSKYDAAYENASGPGDARPDAMQVLTDEGLVGKLHGVVFMVTGGSNGYGLETVRALHAAGATVLMPVRSRERGENAMKDVQKSNGDSPDVGEMHLLDMDHASLESVHKCAKEVLTKHQKLNVLVNNAGAFPISVQARAAREPMLVTCQQTCRHEIEPPATF